MKSRFRDLCCLPYAASPLENAERDKIPSLLMIYQISPGRRASEDLFQNSSSGSSVDKFCDVLDKAESACIYWKVGDIVLKPYCLLWYVQFVFFT